MLELIKSLEKMYGKPIINFTKADWIIICRNNSLSEAFIRKYQDNVYWTYISWFQILSEPFIREFRNKIQFHCLSRQNKLNWLKYKVKNNILTKEQYLMEVLKCKN